MDLASVSHILFVPEHGAYEKLLPNLFAVAAVYRAVALWRAGGEPALQVVAESRISNWAKRFGAVPCLDSIPPGAHVLMLTSAPMYRMDFATLLGAHTIAQSRLLADPELVPDTVPLGHKPSTARPLAPLARKLIGESGDTIVRELLYLAEGQRSSPSEQVWCDSISQALSTLQTRSGIFAFRENRPALEPSEQLLNLIIELASGARTLSLVRDFGADFDSAQEIATSIWDEAAEISPGVFQIEGIPFAERDSLVRKCLEGLYHGDQTARIVLERNPDHPANSLSFQEAATYSLRLTMGESASSILKEVQQVLHARKDTVTLMSIEQGRERRYDNRYILNSILEDAKYVVDPDGCFSVLKLPEDRDVQSSLQAGDFPIIKHGTMWIVNVATGAKMPVMIRFQAQHLERFLALVDHKK